MGSLGVHFALDPRTAAAFLSAVDDGELATLADEVEENGEEHWSCETDKAWDALHRCFTDGTLDTEGGEYPLSFAILGGQHLYEGDDYAIAFVAAEEVADVAAALAPLDENWLRERFFALDAEEYDGALDEEDFDYTWSNLVDLCEFYRRASDAGRAVIFTVAY